MPLRTLTPDDAQAFHALRIETLTNEPWGFGSTLEEMRAVPLTTFARKLGRPPTGGRPSPVPRPGIHALWHRAPGLQVRRHLRRRGDLGAPPARRLGRDGAQQYQGTQYQRTSPIASFTTSKRVRRGLPATHASFVA